MKTVNTITSDEKKYGWVLYDGACGLCRGWARRWQPDLERRGFRLAALQSPWVSEQLGLSGPELLREMRVLTPQGRLLGGAEAVIELARAFWWARWLPLFTRAPFALRFLQNVYRWVAARRHCEAGRCAVEPRGSTASGFSRVTGRVRIWSLLLLPLLILPAAAVLCSVHWPGWLQMWSVAVALFLGLKWLVWGEWRARQNAGVPSTGNGRAGTPGPWRALGFFLLWPGMDAGEFFGSGRARIGTSEWASAAFKTGIGAVLVWGLARALNNLSALLAGWVGMVGLVLLLHFGVFHLLSLGWRSAGVVAKPIMNAPLRAVSLTEFWGRRWNLGFSSPARRFLHRPLAVRMGNGKALLAVFLVSGVLHEVVISVPARAGYGWPAAYFVLQAFAMGLERSAVGRWLGLGTGACGWSFTMLCVGAPAFLLFHPPFVHRVILPFLQTIGAI